MSSTALNLLDAAFLNIERDEDPWSIQLELQLEKQIYDDRPRDAIEYALQQDLFSRVEFLVKAPDFDEDES